MPLVISAGWDCFVGIYALLGIAVSNGIVLIDTKNQLESSSSDLKELGIASQGALRPVCLTASAAAWILPMAKSSLPGAEFNGLYPL